VKAGLAEGDRVIRYPTAMLKDGQTAQASAAGKSSMVAAEQQPGAPGASTSRQ